MKRTIVATLCFLGATQASAHPVEWKPYAGASLAQHEFEDWVMGIPDDGGFTGGSIDEEDTGFGLVAGVEPFEHLGFEVGFHDFGEAELVAQSNGTGSTWAAGPVTQTFSLRAIDVSLVGRLPITQEWGVFGRAGISYYEAEWRLAGTLQPSTPVSGSVGENTHQSPVFGAGIEYRGLGAWSLVASYLTREFERPNTSDASKVASISLFAIYRR
jgi:OOP family OmpA-OmpF porin